LKIVLGAYTERDFNFEIELRNILLAALRTFEFSHRLKVKQTSRALADPVISKDKNI
jgi:hypothetical protein